MVPAEIQEWSNELGRGQVRVSFRIFVKGGGGGANTTIPELRGGKD